MYEKYIVSLQMMDAVIQADPYGKIEDEFRNPITVKWDELFTYIHANFQIPESADCSAWKSGNYQNEYDLCRPLIDHTFPSPSRELEARIRSIPPVILEVVWPVAIARFLLRDCGIPKFSHHRSTTFSVFVDRYKNMILS